MKAVALAHGVGGFKATVHALAIEKVLQEQGVPVLFRTGASGGAIAAAAMSHSVTRTQGIDWLANRLAKIKEKKLYDTDWEQQVIDRARTWFRLPRRKGDTPLLGWYRGNGLLFAFRDLFKDLGTVVSPFAIVSCSLEPKALQDVNVAPLIALNAASGYGQKKVRWFDADQSTHTEATKRIVDAVRASTAIPFVIRPHEINGIHEVDGGTLSLTTEEVAADKLATDFKPPANGEKRKIALIVSDMRSLPDDTDGRADDVVDLGVMLLRAVGAQIQTLNTTYALRKLEPLEFGIWRITSPPQTETKCRQFETGAAPELLEEYTALLREDARLVSFYDWFNSDDS